MAGRYEGVPVLVTGAGGFIGSHLTEALVAEGARVRALVRYTSSGTSGLLAEAPEDVRRQIEIAFGDVRDPDSVAGAVRGVEVVFHLAALIAIPYSYACPRSYVETNIGGTLNVLSAARDAGDTLVVHTSTSEVYGTAQYVPIDEGHPVVGQSPYSASKIGADQFAESFHRAYGLPVVVLRPFNTYGPRQSPRAVIPTIVVQALSGDSVLLGSLSPTRDMTYVADTVEGFLAAGRTPGAVGRTVNLGTGTEVSIRELAERVGKLVGHEVEIVEDASRLRPDASEVDRLLSDPSLARELFGWAPAVGLDEGLGQVVGYVRRHLGRYESARYYL